MDDVLADWQTADVPPRIQAALRLLECLTLRPMEIDEQFIESIRADGLEELAMRELANISFHFNMMNRFADAFDFAILNPKQEALHTKMLNQMGRRLKGRQADPIWTRDNDGHIRPTELSQARRALLNTAGQTAPALRQAVEAYVVTQRGQDRVQLMPVPAELEGYLKKLALYAYKIIDEDVEALREIGYEGEAIYEITAAGAFGAALVGVERLFAVLYDP